MPSTNFVVHGLDELVAKLQQIEGNMLNKAARKAMSRASRGVVRDAKTKVPQRYGLLKLALGVRIKRYGGTHVAVIGARTRFKGKKAEAARSSSRRAARASPANYAHLVEFGTAPHIILPTNARALALLGSNRPVYRVEHPGSSPKPFLRPALDANRDRALTVMAEVLEEEIRKAGV